MNGSPDVRSRTVDLRGRLAQARKNLTASDRLDQKRWREFTDDALAEAQDRGDIDALIQVAQFAIYVLEAEKRYDDMVAEADHFLQLVPESSAAAGVMLALKASVMTAIAEPEHARAVLSESETLLERAGPSPPLRWMSFLEIVRFQLLMPPSERFPSLLRRLTEAKGASDLLFLLNWYIPSLALRGNPKEASPFVRDVSALAENMSHTWRVVDALAFRSWLDILSGRAIDGPKSGQPNPLALWRIACLSLHNALLFRNPLGAQTALGDLRHAFDNLGSWDAGPLSAWQSLVEAEFLAEPTTTKVGVPTLKLTAVSAGAWMAGAMAAALRGSAADATAWIPHVRRLLRAGIKSSLEYPVSLLRIEGLLNLRAGDIRRARRSLEEAAAWAGEAGYPIEAAAAQIQWAQVSAHELPGGRTAWTDSSAEARKKLTSLGIDPTPFAFAVERILAERRGADTTILTPREIEVLRLLAEGMTYKEVAARLGIAWPTIQTHAHRIYEKLGVHRKADAVRVASNFDLL